MMFSALYLASKIEEIQFCSDLSKNIDVFVKGVKEEKYCTVESKRLYNEGL